MGALGCGNSLIRKRLKSDSEMRRLERGSSILPHFMIMARQKKHWEVNIQRAKRGKMGIPLSRYDDKAFNRVNHCIL